MKHVPKSKFPNSSVLDIVTMLSPVDLDPDKMNFTGMLGAFMNPNSLLKSERQNEVYKIIAERGDNFVLYPLERA